MKNETIIIIVLLILVVGFLVWRSNSKKVENPSTEFVKLYSATESSAHLPLLSNNWISEIEKKWNEKEWGIYDNEHYDICEKICNEVYAKNKYWEKGQTHSDFLNELTKEQRVYFTLINFEAQVNNGGVYQFLFNYPELSILALQAMKETGMSMLARDYELVLNEYFGKFDTIQELYTRFQNDTKEWNKRWTSFTEGYDELPSTATVEEYFYEEDYVISYHAKLTEYVKSNRNELYRVE